MNYPSILVIMKNVPKSFLNSMSGCAIVNNKSTSLGEIVELSHVVPFATVSQEDNIELEKSVTDEEIRAAVWDCGSQKAPGPDGFSFLFL